MAVMVGGGGESPRNPGQGLTRGGGSAGTDLLRQDRHPDPGRPTSAIELLPAAAEAGFDESAVPRLAASAETGASIPWPGRSCRPRWISIVPPTAEDFARPRASRRGVGRGATSRSSGTNGSCRVRIDDRDMARFDIPDEPRPDAAAALERIRELGLEIRMLTGDRAEAARRMGDRLGLAADEIVADATPESKLAAIEEAGEGTAMVGDGINDAAALARAQLGIAMAGGTGSAIESAGVVVPPERVSSVADAIHLARRTLTTIRQNLFLAFIYNGLAIPAAAFGLLGVHGPLIAAAAMACSDVSVIGNAIRLRRSLARERSTPGRPAA